MAWKGACKVVAAAVQLQEKNRLRQEGKQRMCRWDAQRGKVSYYKSGK